MGKFKKGDVVRVLDSADNRDRPTWSGRIGSTVTVRASTPPTWPAALALIQIEEDRIGAWWSPQRFELVSPVSPVTKTLAERARDLAMELEAEADRITKAQEDKAKGLRTMANQIRTAANAVKKIDWGTL